MYNRYIGNTGKVIRIEEASDRRERAESIPSPPHVPAPPHDGVNKTRDDNLCQGDVKKSSLLSGFGGLGGLGGGLVKSIDSILPFGLETGDLILLVLFLFLFIESGDEEFLIILGFLAYSLFKENREKI